MFYDVLTNLCQEKGKSLVQVRNDLGISQSTMASWKARGVTPNAATVARLSEYFDVSVDYLLGKNVMPTPAAAHANEDMLHLANILELPPDQKKKFDKSYRQFVETYEIVFDAVLNPNSSIPKILLGNQDEEKEEEKDEEERKKEEEEQKYFFHAVAGLCTSIKFMRDINPKGLDELRSKYKKRGADIDELSRLYGVLNNDGRREAIKRVRELTQIRAYQRFLTDDEQGKIQAARDRISNAEHELRLMERQGVTCGQAVESSKKTILEAQREVGEIMLYCRLEQK